MSIETAGLHDIERYYSAKVLEHGAVARGVDWNGEESQTLRFERLSEDLPAQRSFSLVDWGCGYGAYSRYLRSHFPETSYTGIDISAEMIAAAVKTQEESSMTRFLVGNRPEEPAHWCVASGIFNVRLDRDDQSWFAFICETLDLMNEYSTEGFAFNALTSYSDASKKRDYLYYASPEELFARCKREYSRSVKLLHDYDLYEFTLIVRK
jgi:SAM-dependent methyltransferase